MTAGTKEAFFSASIEQEELERVLRRIDENLALRPVFREQATGSNNQAISWGESLPLPELGDLPWRLQELNHMQAPLFVIKGRDWRNLLKRIINVPIRFFGYKQINFNRDLLEALGIMLIQIQGLRQQAEHQAETDQSLARLQEALAELNSLQAQIKEDQAELADVLVQLKASSETLREKQDNLTIFLHDSTEHQRIQDIQLQQTTAQQDYLAEAIQSLSEGQSTEKTQIQEITASQSAFMTELQGHQKWLEQVARDEQGLNEWIRLLQRKLEILTLDAREGKNSTPELDLPEPRIVDPGQYQQRLASMGECIRINLGCGEKPQPDYINVDFRQVPDVDIVADVRRLPFEPRALAEIASAHLVEHFREYQFRSRILPYWKSLLRTDGALRIICPNWAAMLERLNTGQLSIVEFKRLTFGAQDYVGDDHLAMYTPDTLTDLLISCGFARIEILATERMNDICPEMELLAYL
jgi:hypothetical protein